MKMEACFDPIYAQDGGRKVALTDADIIKSVLDAVLARADLVFQGDDGVVIYRPVDCPTNRGHGRLYIQLSRSGDQSMQQ